MGEHFGLFFFEVVDGVGFEQFLEFDAGAGEFGVGFLIEDVFGFHVLTDAFFHVGDHGGLPYIDKVFEVFAFFTEGVEGFGEDVLILRDFDGLEFLFAFDERTELFFGGFEVFGLFEFEE